MRVWQKRRSVRGTLVPLASATVALQIERCCLHRFQPKTHTQIDIYIILYCNGYLERVNESELKYHSIPATVLVSIISQN